MLLLVFAVVEAPAVGWGDVRTLAELAGALVLVTLGFQRGLFGAGVALVFAAVIALRATNVRAVAMAPDAEIDQASPIPIQAAG